MSVLLRKFPLYTVTLLLVCGSVHGKIGKKKRYEGPPRSEAELVGRVLNCLQYGDTITYSSLFPEFDTVWKRIIEYRATDDKSAQEIAQIRQHPEKVQQFDPYFNPIINKTFMYVEQKGTDSGIHWHDIVLSRYELQKKRLTRDMVGYELIAPVRYKGYVFVEDLLTRKHYCFTVNDVQVIDNYWYGGEVINIFEATNIDEYLAKELAETRMKRKMQEFGITAVASTDSSADKKDKDDDSSDDNSGGLSVNKFIQDPKQKSEDDDAYKQKKEVTDRKYYVGKFDNEIPVKLYVRYLKGPCPTGVCEWQAIYKFGDQDDYIKLDVEMKPDSTWEFTEDPPIGGMDLKLKNKIYTGTWMSSDNETGYDVKLTEHELPVAKAKELDDIIEKGTWAKGLPDENSQEDERGKDIGY